MRLDYPRAGRTGVRHWLPSWRQLLASCALVCVLGVTAFSVVYARTDIPEPNSQALAQTSVLYYADGSSRLGIVGATQRTLVPLAQVPVPVRQAVLSAEDRGFYSHGGVSPRGLARAAWNTLKNDDVQGGSTITQQLVKNYYLTQDRTLSRKGREFVLALKIERTLTKDQILEDYLNTIYWGRSSYGIEAAADAYFRVDASELTVNQAAVLAALIRSPGLYDPDEPDGLERLKGRWAYVLDGMVEQGWLTQEKRDAMRFPTIEEQRVNRGLTGPRGYLVQAAMKELEELGFSPEEVETGGLRIVTTFDANRQRDAIAAVRAERPEEKDVRVGLAAVDPATGGVVAMYGGSDYTERQYDDATQSAPQAGSTFKPFALVAALEDGIGLSSTWNGDSPQTFETPDGGEYEVPNYDGHSYGQVTLLQATESSVNTVYVPLSMQVGGDEVVRVARRAGVPESVAIDPGPTVALGTASPTALDMAGAYATFAAQGTRRDVHVIAEVQTADGGVVYRAKDVGAREFAPDVMADTTYALQKVVTNGSGFAAQAIGRPSAGKTGTTNAGRSAWYIGYVPQLSVAVDLFRPDADGNLQSLDGVGGLDTVTGGSFPARIWTAFMTAALEGVPVEEFPDAANIGGPVATPTPTPTPSESPSPTPTPTGPAETPTPTPTGPAVTPTPTAPPATPSPTPPPTPSPTAEPPTPTPTPDTGGSGETDGTGAAVPGAALTTEAEKIQR